MYQKCTSNSYLYTKDVQTVKNLYKVQIKNGLKIEMYVFAHTSNIRTIQNLYK